MPAWGERPAWRSVPPAVIYITRKGLTQCLTSLLPRDRLSAACFPKGSAGQGWRSCQGQVGAGRRYPGSPGWERADPKCAGTLWARAVRARGVGTDPSPTQPLLYQAQLSRDAGTICPVVWAWRRGKSQCLRAKAWVFVNAHHSEVSDGSPQAGARCSRQTPVVKAGPPSPCRWGPRKSRVRPPPPPRSAQ